MFPVLSHTSQEKPTERSDGWMLSACKLIKSLFLIIAPDFLIPPPLPQFPPNPFCQEEPEGVLLSLIPGLVSSQH